MNLLQTFALFVLPGALAVFGLVVGYYARRAAERPGNKKPGHAH